MFGLKIPIVWLHSAFLLPVPQIQHLMKIYLGFNVGIKMLTHRTGGPQGHLTPVVTLQRSRLSPEGDRDLPT